MRRLSTCSTHRIRWAFWLVVLAGLLAACNIEGVNSFSQDSSRIALRNNDGLYIFDSDGEQEIYLGRIDNPITAPVLTPDGSTIYYIDRFLGRVLAVPTDGSQPPRRMTREQASGNNSVLVWLPSNQLLFIDRREATNRFFMQVIDPDTTEILAQLEDIETIFINAGAVRPRPDSARGEWLLPVLAHEQLRLVFRAANLLFLYTARDSGLEFDEVLPRELTPEDIALLGNRAPSDVTGALLTDDGRRLVLRTRQGSSPNFTYNLYAFDLDSDAPATELVLAAGELPDYAIAPGGHQVIFEVPGAPAVMVQFDFDSGERTALGLDLFDPNWWD